MTPAQLKRIESRLERFLAYCFDGAGRRERVEALHQYLRGLLLDGERKSLAPVALRLANKPAEAEAVRQRLQQAIVVAEWNELELFRRVALRAADGLPGVDAWVLDDTGFPKKGRHSVGVQRQYSGTLGRIDNCQVATSLHLASEHGGVCIGMRLYLPNSWAEDQHRRAKGGVPDGVVFQPKWCNALSLIDDALRWGLKTRPIVGDAEFGDNRQFRQALIERGVHYILNAASHLVVWPPGVEPQPPPGPRGTVGRPPTRWRADGGVPLSIQKVAESLPASIWRTITWRQGSRGPQRGRFAAVRIRTAHRHREGHPPSNEQWLLCEWPRRADKPTTYWLSNLPKTTSLRTLVYLAKLRWRIERDYQEMKGELGLDHFEGRTWRGFHHHAACVAAAHAFLTLERVLFPPEPTAIAANVPASASARAANNDRALPDLR